MLGKKKIWVAVIYYGTIPTEVFLQTSKAKALSIACHYAEQYAGTVGWDNKDDDGGYIGDYTVSLGVVHLPRNTCKAWVGIYVDESGSHNSANYVVHLGIRKAEEWTQEGSKEIWVFGEEFMYGENDTLDDCPGCSYSFCVEIDEPIRAACADVAGWLEQHPGYSLGGEKGADGSTIVWQVRITRLNNIPAFESIHRRHILETMHNWKDLPRCSLCGELLVPMSDACQDGVSGMGCPDSTCTHYTL